MSKVTVVKNDNNSHEFINWAKRCKIFFKISDWQLGNSPIAKKINFECGQMFNHIEFLDALMCPVNGDPKSKNQITLFCKITDKPLGSKTFDLDIPDYDSNINQLRCFVVLYGTAEKIPSNFSCKLNYGNLIPDTNNGSIIIK